MSAAALSSAGAPNGRRSKFPRVQRPLIVGSVLVRNEDVFLERAIRNVAAFCDRIFAVDHRSKDRTWEILKQLAGEYDHLEIRRSSNAGTAHRVLEPFAGTPAWVIGIDGDEVYDPDGLARLREALLGGAHSDVFNVKAHVLNCESLDVASGSAIGYMSPPSRPVTKLFNYAAVTSWKGALERLQGGQPTFRPGYDSESRRWLHETTSWDDDPLRCLHVCFMRRSSLDRSEGGEDHYNLDESRQFKRDPLHSLLRRIRPPRKAPRIAALHEQGSSWKREAYARGDLVTVDARPFRVLPDPV
jgi:glycosyltransferase involved in cell wall biosynthesis